MRHLRKNELSICFQKPTQCDVILNKTGQKIAGAAQKRSRQGIITQGSIDKGSFPSLDWQLFEEKSFHNLAEKLDIEVTYIAWDQLPQYQA